MCIRDRAFGKMGYTTKLVAQLMRDLGSIPAPMNSFILNLGLQSLHLRMRQHCANAQKVAEFLQNDERVAWVHYSGLAVSYTHLDVYKRQKEHIQERHRHRYEFNNEFQQEFEKNGMMCVGRNPESDLVEIVEIPSLKWYVGTQYHPEYQSTVLKPHPLFMDFVKTAIENKK